MATIQGVGGAATATGFNIKASGWSADTILETVDTSGFSDNGYRTREGTVVSMDGTITGTAEGASSVPIPAAVLAATADPTAAQVTVTLTGEAGNLYTFTAAVNNVNHNRAFDGKYDLTLSFQSNGAITQTWA
jgi:hypothetical protein